MEDVISGNWTLFVVFSSDNNPVNITVAIQA